MRQLLLCLTAFLTLTIAYGQTQITFQKTYGNFYQDQAKSIHQTSDGGYIIIGTLFDNVYLLKLDLYGDTLWAKTYGGAYGSQGNDGQQTSDGGYILTGYWVSQSAGADRDVYLIKTDTDGSIMWSKTYGSTNDENGNSVQQTSDGGYIIAGLTQRVQFDFDAYLIRTDSNGNPLWQNAINNVDDEGMSVRETSDGGFILLGITQGKLFCSKMNSNGTISWSQKYQSATQAQGFPIGIEITNDGNFIFAAAYEGGPPGTSKALLIKTASNGNTIWVKSYGGTSYNYACSVAQTSDNGYVFAGYTTMQNSGPGDIYLIKTDPIGDTLWTKEYGGPNADIGYSVEQVPDGGYVIAGSCGYNFNGRGIYIIKTDSSGNSNCNVKSQNTTVNNITLPITPITFQLTSNGSVGNPPTQVGNGGTETVLCATAGVNNIVHKEIDIQIYPNPFSVQTTLQTDDFLHNVTLTVYNCFGQQVKQFVIRNSDSFVIRRDNLPSGLYFIRIAELRSQPTVISPSGEGWGEVIATDKLVITDN